MLDLVQQSAGVTVSQVSFCGPVLFSVGFVLLVAQMFAGSWQATLYTPLTNCTLGC